jgi:hypothetical protein
MNRETAFYMPLLALPDELGQRELKMCIIFLFPMSLGQQCLSPASMSFTLGPTMVKGFVLYGGQHFQSIAY